MSLSTWVGGATLLLLLLLSLQLRRRFRPSRLKIVVVIDGDTCAGVDTRGVLRKLRLHGIDAPEKGQVHAKEAKEALCALVLHRWVSVRWRGRDRYQRFVVSLHCEGKNASSWLLSQGLAFPAYRSGWMAFAALKPRVMGQGVWSSHRRPQDSWRRRHRLLAWLAWKVERNVLKK